MEFTYQKNGNHYAYRLSETYFHWVFTNPKDEKTELKFSWKNLKNLDSENSELVFIGTNKKKIPVPLKSQDSEAFLKAVASFWQKTDRAAALKAASEYVNPEKKLWWIWLIISFFLFGGTSAYLLTDGYQLYFCNKSLKTGHLAEALVTEAKKNRKGHVVWDLWFTAQEGENAGKVVRGKRIAVGNAGLQSKNQKVTVVYSGRNLKCWDVSTSAGKNSIRWPERKLSVLLDMLFGHGFLIIFIASTIWLIRKLRAKHPYQDLVSTAFGLSSLNIK